jgi:hypothetical protein
VNQKPGIPKNIILVLLLPLLMNWTYTSLYGQVKPDFLLSESSLFPSLNVDNVGNVHAVWTLRRQDSLLQTTDSISYAIYDSLFRAVKAPQKISEQWYSVMYNPCIAIGNNAVLIIWERQIIYDIFTSYIFGQLMTLDGQPIYRNFMINEPMSKRLRIFPNVANLNDSTFFVVWSGWGSQTPGFYGVYGRMIADKPQPMSDIIYISDDTTETNNFPASVASNSKSNHFVVTWLKNPFSVGSQVLYRQYTKDGIPTSDPLKVNEREDFSQMWGPDVVMDGTGNFSIVWSAEVDSVWGIYIRRFNSAGMPQGISEQISHIKVVRNSNVYISMDDEQRYVIAWEGRQEGLSRIYAQRFSQNHTTLGENFKISSSPDTTSHFNHCIVFRNGKIYTAWPAWHAVPDIWANIIDFNNPPPFVHNDINTFSLYQNFPNPFNMKTLIRYDLPVNAYVEITVYDLLGQRVKTLTKGLKPPGSNVVLFEAEGLSSGLYFYRMKANEFNKVKKMIILK